MRDIALSLLQALLAMAVAPWINGVIRKVKATLQGRRGPSVWQPYRDLAKYFAKDAVVSKDASWLFRAAPYVSFAALMAAALWIPVLVQHSPLGFAGDIVLVVYLFGVVRFFTLLAAMDTGSAFTGMGASREAMLSALSEPALLLGLFMLGLTAGTLQLDPMIASTLHGGWDAGLPVRLLTLAAFAVIVVVETGRVPVDNPATHLELTMIHEGLILEHSGKYLGLASWSHALKQLLLFTLFIDLFLPWGIAEVVGVGSLAIALLAYLVKLALLAFGVGVLESVVAKFRLFQVPDLIGASFVFSVLSLISFVLVR